MPGGLLVIQRFQVYHLLILPTAAYISEWERGKGKQSNWEPDLKGATKGWGQMSKGKDGGKGNKKGNYQNNFSGAQKG